jgi:hypothetical protein
MSKQPPRVFIQYRNLTPRRDIRNVIGIIKAQHPQIRVRAQGWQERKRKVSGRVGGDDVRLEGSITGLLVGQRWDITIIQAIDRRMFLNHF